MPTVAAAANSQVRRCGVAVCLQLLRRQQVLHLSRLTPRGFPSRVRQRSRTARRLRPRVSEVNSVKSASSTGCCFGCPRCNPCRDARKLAKEHVDVSTVPIRLILHWQVSSSQKARTIFNSNCPFQESQAEDTGPVDKPDVRKQNMVSRTEWSAINSTWQASTASSEGSIAHVVLTPTVDDFDQHIQPILPTLAKHLQHSNTLVLQTMRAGRPLHEVIIQFHMKWQLNIATGSHPRFCRSFQESQAVDTESVSRKEWSSMKGTSQSETATARRFVVSATLVDEHARGRA